MTGQPPNSPSHSILPNTTEGINDMLPLTVQSSFTSSPTAQPITPAVCPPRTAMEQVGENRPIIPTNQLQSNTTVDVLSETLPNKSESPKNTTESGLLSLSPHSSSLLPTSASARFVVTKEMREKLFTSHWSSTVSKPYSSLSSSFHSNEDPELLLPFYRGRFELKTTPLGHNHQVSIIPALREEILSPLQEHLLIADRRSKLQSEARLRQVNENKLKKTLQGTASYNPNAYKNRVLLRSSRGRFTKNGTETERNIEGIVNDVGLTTGNEGTPNFDIEIEPEPSDLHKEKRTGRETSLVETPTSIHATTQTCSFLQPGSLNFSSSRSTSQHSSSNNTTSHPSSQPACLSNNCKTITSPHSALSHIASCATSKEKITYQPPMEDPRSLGAILAEEASALLGPNPGGALIWSARLCPNEKALAKVFSSALGCFGENEAMLDTQRVLALLHSSHYDPELALCLLKPLVPSVTTEEDDKGESEPSFPGDDLCFVCQDGGVVILCEQCPKVFHPSCVNMDKIPDGVWSCHHHSCTTCKTKLKNTIFACSTCLTAYCSNHTPARLHDKLLNYGISEFQCSRCVDSDIKNIRKLKMETAQAASVAELAAEKALSEAEAAQNIATALAKEATNPQLHSAQRLKGPAYQEALRQSSLAAARASQSAAILSKSAENLARTASICNAKASKAAQITDLGMGKQAFYNRLLALLRRSGDPLRLAPTIEGVEVDLYTIYAAFISRGGFAAVLRTTTGLRCVWESLGLRIITLTPEQSAQLKMYVPPPLPSSGSNSTSMSGSSLASLQSTGASTSLSLAKTGEKEAGTGAGMENTTSTPAKDMPNGGRSGRASRGVKGRTSTRGLSSSQSDGTAMAGASTTKIGDGAVTGSTSTLNGNNETSTGNVINISITGSGVNTVPAIAITVIAKHHANKPPSAISSLEFEADSPAVLLLAGLYYDILYRYERRHFSAGEALTTHEIHLIENAKKKAERDAAERSSSTGGSATDTVGLTRRRFRVDGSKSLSGFHDGGSTSKITAGSGESTRASSQMGDSGGGTKEDTKEKEKTKRGRNTAVTNTIMNGTNVPTTLSLSNHDTTSGSNVGTKKGKGVPTNASNVASNVSLGTGRGKSTASAISATNPGVTSTLTTANGVTNAIPTGSKRGKQTTSGSTTVVSTASTGSVSSRKRKPTTIAEGNGATTTSAKKQCTVTATNNDLDGEKKSLRGASTSNPLTNEASEDVMTDTPKDAVTNSKTAARQKVSSIAAPGGKEIRDNDPEVTESESYDVLTQHLPIFPSQRSGSIAEDNKGSGDGDSEATEDEQE